MYYFFIREMFFLKYIYIYYKKKVVLCLKYSVFEGKICDKNYYLLLKQ